MHRILVPWEVGSAGADKDGGGEEPSRHAAYFALEFAKRTKGTVMILLVHGEPASSRQSSAGEDQPEELKRLLQEGLRAGVPVESYVTAGDFVSRVAEFAYTHRVSRIILALPEGDGPESQAWRQRAEALKEKVDCVLVTVRPRRQSEPTRTGR